MPQNKQVLSQLPQEIIIQITRLLGVSDVLNLLKIIQYTKEVGSWFRVVESENIHSTKEPYFNNLDHIEKIKLIDVFTENLKVSKSFIYFIEIFSWENFNARIFKNRFKDTYNLIVIHEDFDKVSETEDKDNQLKFTQETFKEVIGGFPNSTVIFNAKDGHCSLERVNIDPDRLLFTSPLHQLRLDESNFSKPGKIHITEIKNLRLIKTRPQTLTFFDYDHVGDLYIASYDELNLGPTSTEYAPNTDYDPYILENWDLRNVTNANFEGIHRFMSFTGNMLKTMKITLRCNADQQQKYGLFDINSTSLETLHLMILSPPQLPILQNINTPSVKELRISAIMFRGYDGPWDDYKGESLNLPNLNTLDIRHCPSALNILEGSLSTVTYLMVSCTDRKEEDIIGLHEFPNLVKIEIDNFSPNNRTLFPKLKAPRLSELVVKKKYGYTNEKYVFSAYSVYPTLNKMVLKSNGIFEDSSKLEWDEDLNGHLGFEVFIDKRGTQNKVDIVNSRVKRLHV